MIRRYDLEINRAGDARMVEQPFGAWIKWDDIRQILLGFLVTGGWYVTGEKKKPQPKPGKKRKSKCNVNQTRSPRRSTSRFRDGHPKNNR